MKTVSRPHYFAIVKSLVDGKHFVTNHLYPDAEEAKRDIGTGFLRLWSDGPMVMLEVFEDEAKKKKEERVQAALAQGSLTF